MSHYRNFDPRGPRPPKLTPIEEEVDGFLKDGLDAVAIAKRRGTRVDSVRGVIESIENKRSLQEIKKW